MMRKVLLTLLIALTVGSAIAQKVNVAAAANLRYVLEEIKTAYLKSYPKSVINLTFGSSGTLVQQISNGASFDFFMAADDEFPLKLKDKGLTIGPMTTYAFGKLALYSTTFDVNKLGLEVLKDASVKRIAVANPETAPYGERSVALIKSFGLQDALKPKLVVAENISVAAQYAFTGNVEVGFVALSLTLAPDMAGKGSCFIVPEKLYKPIEQSCILIKRSVLNTEAIRFRTFVLSKVTKPLWEKYGYTIPE
jgi:molybdate transport system substrate-binding protein